MQPLKLSGKNIIINMKTGHKMETVTEYTYKGYDIEIFKTDNDDYILDIKYPCGELVEGFCHIETLTNAVKKASNQLLKLPHAKHENCLDEYCN